jgi:hypothetical protein
MPLHDVRYQHWQGTSTGIWRRRWAIAKNGLTACLQYKILRATVVSCWMMGLGLAGAIFLISQLLVPDSIVVRWVEQLNPGLQDFAQLLTRWLKEHPDISVRATQNVIFYYATIVLTGFGIFTLVMAMPFLITRDLASSAIIIYSSKAVSRTDYLIGKFMTAFGLLGMTTLGPIVGAWVIGNLLAPDWLFFWHSRGAIGNALLYNLVTMTVLSLLALGVSAVSNKERTTPFLWMMWWVLGFFLQPIAANTRPWLRHLSFSYDLHQIGLATFRLGNEIRLAQDNIPILGEMMRNIPQKTMDDLAAPHLLGAILWLAAMLAGAAFILRRKVRPE